LTAATALVVGVFVASRPASAQETGWVLQGEAGLSPHWCSIR
jgi:hypothetical protein